MANKNNDEVFTLIKSLSRSEKRYFKRYALINGMKKKNNYLRLFKAMERMKGYDEKKLKIKFRGETFTKQIHVTKVYLYKIILRSMRAFHAENSTASGIRGMLSDVAFLHQKGINAGCRKLIRKAKKEAYKYEKHILLLDIMSWEEMLLHAEGSAGLSENKIREFFSERKLITDLHRNENEYRYFHFIIFHFMSQQAFLPHSKKALGQYQKMADQFARGGEDRALTYRSRFHYFLANANYHFYCRSYALSNKYYEKVVAWTESNPQFLEESPFAYVNNLYNLALTYERIREYKTAIALFQKIRALLPSGSIKTIKVCVSCIQAGKVSKPSRAKQPQ